ncbi:allophanate hydrolase [Azospirillum halopraeferens]|uniref:allophanate hydrolase n=1 Tax=Azospirillum halopraeferens TaxID=34010 RepID=UPI0003F65DC7|nr:allophanate hydrolase [Azospirillum halopraeferens]
MGFSHRDSLDIASLRARYLSGAVTPRAVAESVLNRIAAYGDDAVWIARESEVAVLTAAEALAARSPAELPLYGIPFAVKDNIDVAGLRTTAACPEFAYEPRESAAVVQRLTAAGALFVGKTNLDQFATGLVGVRSPFGAVRNSFDPAYVSGGSSSGSAVAVAAGLVSFALGTDTAGSGRVPAAFNNIVGLKPTCGLLSTRGVVPACRSLDCVSVFALTVADAAAVGAVAAGYDAHDAFSRPEADRVDLSPVRPAPFRFAVPLPDQLQFFGNQHTPRLFVDAIARLKALGGTAVAVDFAPFLEAARLLYEGPRVAERTAAVGDFLAAHPGVGHPVVRAIIEAGGARSAVEAFRADYRLRELARAVAPVWRRADVLLTPTAGTIYTIAEVEAEPVRLNSNLGTYTNFMNLLDLCGVAVPSGFQPDGLPFGITLAAPAFAEPQVLGIAAAFHEATGLPLGATGVPQAPPEPAPEPGPRRGRVRVAVVGAHMTGLPLNHELTARGGRLVRSTRTSSAYRLYALPGTRPARPGLVRTGEGGAIEVEVWEMPAAGFGELVAGIPAPLGIGTLELEDGGTVQGFLCEACAAAGAEDITAYGGWRAWLAR